MKFLYSLFFFLLFINIGCQSAHKVQPSLLGSSVDHENLHFRTRDTETLSLAELRSGKKGTVLIFWQRTCPCVKRYQGRVNTLFDRYGDKLAFFHVSSSMQEPFAEVLAEYERRHIPLPLIFDEGARLKKALDVRGTPSAALLSDSGELKFLGWIDNERNPYEHGRIAYLEDAISHYLKDEAITVPSSPMFGCAIR